MCFVKTPSSSSCLILQGKYNRISLSISFLVVKIDVNKKDKKYWKYFDIVKGDREEPGKMGNGRGKGEEKRGRWSGIPKVVGKGEVEQKFRNNAQYFSIGIKQRGGNHYGRGREMGVKSTGGEKVRTSLPSPPPQKKISFLRTARLWRSDSQKTSNRNAKFNTSPLNL